MNDVPQLAVLIVSLTAGIAAGLVYELNCIVRALCKQRAAWIAADVLFFLAFV